MKELNCGKSIFLFWGLMVAAVIMNLVTLKQGHNWGDDFAQYILYAKNLLAGHALTDGITRDLSASPPPGMAFLLAPVMWLRGVDFLAFKALNIFFWFGSVTGLYLFLRSRDSSAALMTSVILSFSSFFFIFKQNVLSDIPFLFFFVWAIYCFDQYEKTDSRRYGVWFLVFSAVAFLVRSSGLVLFLAAFLYLFLNRMKRRDLFILLVVPAATALLGKAMVGARIGDMGYMFTHPITILGDSWGHWPNTFKSILWTVIPSLSGLAQQWNRVTAWLFSGCAYIFLPALLGFLLYRIALRKASFVFILVSLYVLGMFIWGAVPHAPEHFARYALPVSGLLLFYALHVLGKDVFIRISAIRPVRIVVALVVALNLLNIYSSWSFDDDVMLKPASREMFAWVGEHLKGKEAVFFVKPRALSLMADVPTVSLSYYEDVRRKAQDYRVGYAVFSKDTTLFFSQIFFSYNMSMEHVWGNERFDVFKIVPLPEKSPAMKGEAS